MPRFSDAVIHRFERLALLIVPYAIILVCGHGGCVFMFMCLRFSDFFSNSDDLTVNRLAWIGIIAALVAARLAPERFYAAAVSVAAAFLVTSVLVLASGFSDGSGGIPLFSLLIFFTGIASLVIWEWLIFFQGHNDSAIPKA